MPQSLSRPPILIVDDEKPQLEILTRWLDHAGYEPVCADNGFDAIAKARETRFEVVVTDLRMPGLSGLQLLSIFKELDPNVEFIFLTGQGTMQDATEALREGKAYDFLQKPLRDLHKLKVVIEGARARRLQAIAEPRPEAPVAAMTATAVMTRPSPAKVRGTIDAPTEQELSILRLLAEGCDNRAIADKLCFSEKTIRNYLSRIYSKLGVENRLQALAHCQQNGIL